MQDIIIRGLCKSFGEKAVLCNVSGTLAAGRITGLMAPSGAGKTTLLRILMGLERADSGRIDGCLLYTSQMQCWNPGLSWY